MFRRAYISVVKNKGRTIILGLLLFVIANLVLSSISIKSATNEAMDQARISLGAEITLTTNNAEIFDLIREYKDIYGTPPDKELRDTWLVPITSDIAYGIAESEYVEDFNFVYSSASVADDFHPVSTEGILDLTNVSKISITGTFNPLLLDEFSDNGTFDLTLESLTFTGAETGVIIISENLAYLNSIEIGDTIGLLDFESNPMSFEVVGLFNSEDTLSTSGRANSDNQVFINLDDALILQGQNPDDIFTITSAKYYLNDPLNIDLFTQEETENYTLISDGTLMFNDVNYDAVTGPLENVSTFSNIVLIVSVIASVIILTLLIINTLKERKYEIGVLLSLGEEKVKISLQYLVELLLVAVVAFSISMVTSNSVSGYLGEILLENEISSASSDEPESKMGGGKGSLSITQLGDVEYIDEIDVSVSFNDFIVTLAIGSMIIIISSVIPSLYITKFQPKKILSSRN